MQGIVNSKSQTNQVLYIQLNRNIPYSLNQGFVKVLWSVVTNHN